MISHPNLWLAAAAALTAATGIFHLVLGGRDVVRPLMASALPDDVRFTAYLGWHIVTIVLFGLAVCFLLPALHLASRDLAWLATATSVLMAAWTMAVILRYRLSPFTYPQWALFLPMGGLGLAGLL